ncbi:MAG: YqgE/AlgH family protein [Micrococcales bacterium]|uniref:YqgE/AlgH family protein n=1 Tax=Phycicoccus sp. TaxID=1902410 RepID=UPI001994A85E|nr:YqgE/AlgH family protein [Phycicoccus sp.]MBD3781883.1 YqgE/AlgH family protein [Micrococcales bacterium]HMM93939.1 YqgE/AlgH family protein [Phycicoccus sp.]
MSASPTTGRLLVATPQIEEGVFRRSVVLVLHHGDDGAQGLVLNRPIEAGIDAVLPGWEEHASRPRTMFQGGPVQLDSALGLVAVPGDSPEPRGVRRLFGAVALVDLDTPPPLVTPELSALRIFAGYAGWSPGQLEEELVTGSWYVVDAEGGDAFTDRPDDLWQRVLRRQPEPLRWMAWFPPDPALN